MMTHCPLDGSLLILHASHRWPCMQPSGCACPTVGSCPECAARALALAKANSRDTRDAEKRERLKASALMQKSFEARNAREAAKKAARKREEA